MTRQPLDEAGLATLCRALVGELGLVPPFDLAELCAALTRQRGRPVVLTARDLADTGSVGHLVCYPRRDVIYYHVDAPTAQQTQVICHEVIHLVRMHPDETSVLLCAALMSAATRARAGGRQYLPWQEWEAENGATILAGLARQRRHPQALPGPTRGPERGIAAAFGLLPQEWR